MKELLLPLVGLMLDIGNVIFFVVNFPQLVSAFKNRKDIKGLSPIMLLGYILATVFFGLVAYATGGNLATILCIINSIIYAIQLYWIRKYRKR
jgi:hypothetical protein